MATISTTARPAYVYDAGGDQWVPIAWTVLGSGAASAPALTFTGDSNTGLWSPGADTVAFSTGGVERLRIGSTGNVGIGTTSPGAKLSFGTGTIGTAGEPNVIRLYDTGTASTSYGLGISSGVLNVASAGDASIWTSNVERMRITSAGYVGIGTSNPPHHLDVASGASFEPRIGITNTNTDAHAGYLVFEKDPSDNLISTNDALGTIRWRAPNTGGSQIDAAEIRVQADAPNTATSTAGRMVFYTTPNNGTTVERMRIDSNGNVGIGTSSPGAKLDVRGNTGSDSGIYVTAVAGIAQIQQRRVNGTGNTSVSSGDIIGDQLFAGWDGSSFQIAARIRATVDATPGAGDMPGRLQFYTTADGGTTENERMRIDNAGLITGTGTSLGAWTSYTPSIGGGWVLGNGTTAGRYCRIGKVVHFSARLVVGSTTTTGTSLTISLPFTPVTANQNINIPATFTDSGTAYYLAGALAFSGNSNAEVFAIGTDGQVKAITATVPFTWATTDEVHISGTYEIA